MKEKSAKSEQSLSELKNGMDKILISREEYRPLARKVSKYFFVLYSMNTINSMYEFSLKSYKELFLDSLSDKDNLSAVPISKIYLYFELNFQ